MGENITVEEAATILHIVPPQDAALAVHLVKIVSAGLRQRGESFKEEWKQERESWRLYVDPDCIYDDRDHPSDVRE